MSPITQQLQGESWGEIRTCSTHQTQLICAEEVEEIWLHSIPSWLSGIPRMHAHMKGARVGGGTQLLLSQQFASPLDLYWKYR